MHENVLQIPVVNVLVLFVSMEGTSAPVKCNLALRVAALKV